MTDHLRPVSPNDNAPWAFWQLLGMSPGAHDWDAAAQSGRACLAGLPVAAASGGADETVAAILGEAQFGPGHLRLSPARHAYYRLRPFLPERVRPFLQRLAARGHCAGGLLRWPIEDRYVRYQFALLRALLEASGLSSCPFVHFWPDGHRFALVLTHDVETEEGRAYVRRVAGLEESLGFRSCFNFVPEGYAADRGLLAELRQRGFEVGVHGLTHDGQLFSCERTFRMRAERINAYFKAWQAAGFRSPMMHRNPSWIQALEAEYDCSFFDTDPFEPMPGGTMSIWPFFLGRFVELPYTLAQDHTLLRTLGETTPRLWLEKAAFIRRHCGMALVDTHPDYLRDPRYLAAYESFLVRMRQEGGYWQALPVEVARWWRARAGAEAIWDGHDWTVAGPAGATVGRASPVSTGEAEGGEMLVLEPRGV